MHALQELRETLARLRAPDGCIWDREQTHQSICEHLIEECAELLDTIDRLDFPHMREELGDILAHIFMQAQMAEEAGHFTIEDVAHEANEKLIRRHPHVFADAKAETIEALAKQWDAIKAQEKKHGPKPSGVLKLLPPRLTALLYARDTYKNLKKQDLCEQALPGMKKTVQKQAKGLSEEVLGAALFKLTAVSEELGLDPESALRRYVTTLRAQVESAVE